MAVRERHLSEGQKFHESGERQTDDGEDPDDDGLLRVQLLLEREAENHGHQQSGEQKGGRSRDVGVGYFFHRVRLQHEYGQVTNLDRERVRQAVHGQLLVVFGVHDQQLDLVIAQYLAVLGQVMPGLHDLVHSIAFILECLGAGGDVVVGLLQQLSEDLFARNVGIDGRDLRNDAEVALEGRPILDVGQPDFPTGLGEVGGVVDQPVVSGQMIGDGHDSA